MSGLFLRLSWHLSVPLESCWLLASGFWLLAAGCWLAGRVGPEGTEQGQLEVKRRSVGPIGQSSMEDSEYRILYLGYRIQDIMQDTGLNLLTQPGGP